MKAVVIVLVVMMMIIAGITRAACLVSCWEKGREKQHPVSVGIKMTRRRTKEQYV